MHPYDTLVAFARENALNFDIEWSDEPRVDIRLNGDGEGENFYTRRWGTLEEAVGAILRDAKNYYTSLAGTRRAKQ